MVRTQHKTDPVVVLHSGGLDSTVCLLLALEKGKQATSLGIDYRQRHRVELQYAAALCQRFGVARRVIRLEWDKPEREMPTGRPVSDIGKEVSPAFLPGRNLVFLSVACAEASGLGASEVWVGINSIEFSGYPDCTPEFLTSYQNTVMAAGMPNLKIVAPLLTLGKKEIAAEARRLGLGPDDTWSCYRPQEVNGIYKPCGECDACVLHNHAWGDNR